MDLETLYDAIGILVAATCLNAIGFSRLWLCGTIGLLLPPWVAFPVAIASAVIGNYAILHICRSERFRLYLERPIRTISSLYSKIHLGAIGIPGVIAARQIPLPSLVISVLLANARVSRHDYLLGTLLGYAPSTAIAVIASGAAARFMPPHMMAITAAALCVVAGIASLLKIKRKARQSNGCAII